jgi:hypothetical protein
VQNRMKIEEDLVLVAVRLGTLGVKMRKLGLFMRDRIEFHRQKLMSIHSRVFRCSHRILSIQPETLNN